MNTPLLYCAALTGLCVIGDYCAKTQRPLTAILLWWTNSAIWVWLYQKHNLPLALTGALYSVLYYVGACFLGVYVFNETFGPVTRAGLALGAVSVLLLASGK